MFNPRTFQFERIPGVNYKCKGVNGGRKLASFRNTLRIIWDSEVARVAHRYTRQIKQQAKIKHWVERESPIHALSSPLKY